MDMIQDLTFECGLKPFFSLAHVTWSQFPQKKHN